MRTLPLFLFAFALGCSSRQLTAMDACHKLEAAGVATNCKPDKPGGLGAAAVEQAVFDLPSVPGKTGQVLRFDRDDFYDNAVTAFGNAALLSGPHRYGSKKARIFLQMNKEAPLDVGQKAKAVVDAL